MLNDVSETELSSLSLVSLPRAQVANEGPSRPQGRRSQGRRITEHFLGMAMKIGAFKSANQPVTKGTIDQLVSALRSINDQDRACYERVEEELRVE